MKSARTAGRIGVATAIVASGLLLGILAGATARGTRESHAISGMIMGGGLGTILFGLGVAATHGWFRLVFAALTLFMLGVTIQGFRLV